MHTLAYADDVNAEMPAAAAEERITVFAILLQRTGRERLVEFVNNQRQLRLVLRPVAGLQLGQVVTQVLQLLLFLAKCRLKRIAEALAEVTAQGLLQFIERHKGRYALCARPLAQRVEINNPP